MHAIHRDRERLVRLGRERAEGHGTGDEAAPDLFRRLHLVERDRRLLGKVEQVTWASRCPSPHALVEPGVIAVL